MGTRPGQLGRGEELISRGSSPQGPHLSLALLGLTRGPDTSLLGTIVWLQDFAGHGPAGVRARRDSPACARGRQHIQPVLASG